MQGTAALSKNRKEEPCWRGFKPGSWSGAIDVRDFIVSNATPYLGDESFLAGASKRTKAVWDKLQPYFQEERAKGVLAADPRTPSTLLAHNAGYIDRANEVIVGLQTDQPFKRAIFPYGGLRMVEAGLEAAGVEAGRAEQSPRRAWPHHLHIIRKFGSWQRDYICLQSEKGADHVYRSHYEKHSDVLSRRGVCSAGLRTGRKVRTPQKRARSAPAGR
jgi:hypothetical protein